MDKKVEANLDLITPDHDLALKQRTYKQTNNGQTGKQTDRQTNRQIDKCKKYK
jgi:hypothetical protein